MIYSALTLTDGQTERQCNDTKQSGFTYFYKELLKI